ncbi:hypothetical protein NECAME_00760 [Necator americanus]|uniref:Uncharacterized protein n=1 Tax=Necator americanus TaxID=51031 RepID=W2SYG5_NECAM|nr:hypothetical protein NECAME_00760 [Necator americanus]ETN73672.1 hypothetical protein NECAME_00760 [Necator americanus]
MEISGTQAVYSVSYWVCHYCYCVAAFHAYASPASGSSDGLEFVSVVVNEQQPACATAIKVCFDDLASPPLNGNVVSHPIHVQESPLPSRSRDYSGGGNVIYTAEDRYYSSSATPGDRRPDSYRASKF